MSSAPSQPAARRALPLAASLDDELWRRAEARREAELHMDAPGDDRLLLSLVLSLARLAAQRDTMARA